MSGGDATRSARQTRQDRRRELARGELLAGALRVLLREGLPRFTLEAAARECGVTRQGLLYHFAGKDDLVFELFLSEWAAMAEAIGEAVARAPDGPAALAAIIEATVAHYQGRLDLFRLVTQKVQDYEHGALSAAHRERLRPLNERMYAEAARKLSTCRLPPGSDPRRLAFSAHVSALGLLTMKSLAERFDDPLRHSDRNLVAEMCGVFRAATSKGARR
jgi:AcrR family transcriptional regulator